jgi:hypothetical protein
MPSTQKGGCFGCLFTTTIITGFLFLLIIAITIIQIGNILNYKTLYHFGVRQYFANILHHDSADYYEAKADFKIYDRIIKMEDLDRTPKTLLLKEGQRFEYHGYRNVGYVSWVAIKVFKNEDPIYGYFMMPINYLEIYKQYMNQSQEGRSEFEKRIYGDIRDEVFKRLKIMEATDGPELQRIKESKEFVIIDTPYLEASSQKAYYCSTQDWKTIQSICNAYMENIDKMYIQTEDQVTIKNASFEKKFTSQFYKNGHNGNRK